MRKVIAAINMTIDGFCDHTAVSPEDDVHQYFADLLDGADVIIYGRKTYQLMRYWQDFLIHPSGEAIMDNFAKSIDRIPKVVFSTSLKETGWRSARLAERDVMEEVIHLKAQSGRPILIGSPGMIVTLANLGLIDEFQLCVHPVVEGKGLPLFKKLHTSLMLHQKKTLVFNSGAIMLFYTTSDR